MQLEGQGTTAPQLPAGLPHDWHLERDLPCPSCRYNLRMLHTPRCPECGTVFRWQEVLAVDCPRCGLHLRWIDGRKCPNCFLGLDWAFLLNAAPETDRKSYEYADRPFRPAMRCMIRLLSPRGFWSRIRIEMPPATARLRAYRRAMIGLASAGVILAAMAGVLYWRVTTLYVALAVTFGLPALTALILPRFTPTLTRFRVRRDQLARCLAYAWSGAGWIGLIVLAYLSFVVVLAFVGPTPPWMTFRAFGVFSSPDWRLDLRLLTSPVRALSWTSSWSQTVTIVAAQFTLLAILTLSTVWLWRFLYVGLHHYLQLRRVDAIALLVSTQLISLLILGLFITCAGWLLAALSAYG